MPSSFDPFPFVFQILGFVIALDEVFVVKLIRYVRFVTLHDSAIISVSINLVSFLSARELFEVLASYVFQSNG